MYQVLDEADRLLDMDFGPLIDEILKVIPRERTTYLFSATMTTKVAKLQRASLSNPVRVEVSGKYVKNSFHSCTPTHLPPVNLPDIRPSQRFCNTTCLSRLVRRMSISSTLPTPLHKIPSSSSPGRYTTLKGLFITSYHFLVVCSFRR